MSEKANKPAYPWWGKFKVGDKVVVCRKVAAHTEGFNNSWVPSMNAHLDKVYTIRDVRESSGECYFQETDMGWPLAGLEKVGSTKPVSLDPITCQLQTGDVVEIRWPTHRHHGKRAEVVDSSPSDIRDGKAHESVQITLDGVNQYWSRYALKLVYRHGQFGAEQIKSMVVKPEAKQPEKPPVEHGKMPSDLKGIEEMVKRMTKEVIGEEPAKEASKKSNQGVLTMAGEKYIGMGFNDQL